MTLGEIRKGINKLTEGQKKQALSSWLEKEIPLWFDSRLLAIDNSVADYWGQLQAKMTRPLPAVDSLIAATALYHNLCLVTRNVNDFDYPNLNLLNLWD
jgi:predicted nucleic acid-binding protein